MGFPRRPARRLERKRQKVDMHLRLNRQALEAEKVVEAWAELHAKNTMFRELFLHASSNLKEIAKRLRANLDDEHAVVVDDEDVNPTDSIS